LAAVPIAATKDKDHKVGPPKPISVVDKTGPSVEYQGFSKIELNDRYYEQQRLIIHGRPTYWNEEITFFIYWQGEVQRWAVCDAASFTAVKAGQFPGWAYKEDHKHLAQANGWMEAWNGEWQQPDLEVTFRSASTNKPQWDDPILQKGIATVEFHGLSMKELNTRYYVKPSEVIQGRPSYWDNSGVYFIYWQAPNNRWAICDLKCHEAVKLGECPGWAYRMDSGSFANACGWMEARGGEWCAALVETAVIGACTKGLKVEFSGFFMNEMNTQFVEKQEEDIQGKPSFWDKSGNYFIYWQSPMSRWAICDKVSLEAAKAGLSPGWAYRTDSRHFAKGTGWMEAWGRGWRQSNARCTVLEGTVREDWAQVKAEFGTADSGTRLSVDQYRSLIQKVYAQKNPSKLDDVEQLLEKYKGREHELYSQVCEKYQVDAAEFAIDSPSVAAPVGAAGDAPVAEQEAPQFAKKEEDDYAGAELPELSPQDYAIHIQSVYEQYNPKKLQDMGRLLVKYRNREAELYNEVCKKYGVHPAKFCASRVKDEENRRG